MEISAIKAKLMQEVENHKGSLISYCQDLVRIPSENPPADTKGCLAYIENIMKQIDGVQISYHVMEDPRVNMVATIDNGPGKHLVFNGHLDTFPIGDRKLWSVDPLGGEMSNGRIYGRGVADMKGGVVCELVSFLIMAAHRSEWSGKISLVLVSDEESMGFRGTKFVVDTVPGSLGDACISGDVGTPHILRFGEKGQIRFDLVATGKEAHGAHVHKGINAIDILVEGITRINELRNLPVCTPEKVRNAILAASEVSERFSGKGETKVLQSVTVNFGTIHGGYAPNLVPGSAEASCSIRVPIGLSVDDVEQKVLDIVNSIDGLKYVLLGKYSNNYSDVDHELFKIMQADAEEILQRKVVVTMRVGGSDTRYYRLKGIPAVTCGLTPHNMGAPDEYIEIEELVQIAKIHTATAYDYLKKDN